MQNNQMMQRGGGQMPMQATMRNAMLANRTGDLQAVLIKAIQNQIRPQAGWQAVHSQKERLVQMTEM